MAEIKLTSISKSFDRKPVLTNINLDSNNGELIVILGPSGCGKSTILRLIAGLEDPDSGEIYIGHRRVDNLPPRKRNTALVFQNYALYPHMTVEKNLAFPLKIARLTASEIKEKVKETAELIGLADRLKSYPAQLSGGQRQRVALGRAIIRQPELFLLDEPLSNLDAELRTRMRREIVQLQKKLGVTTIYVTHDQTEALTMADRIVVLNEGEIKQIGTVDQIYNAPADIFVAGFVGTPRMNFIKGWIGDGQIKPFNISTIYLPSEYSMREFVLGLRPENIKIDRQGILSGIVRDIEYLGDRYNIRVDFLNESLIISSDIADISIGNEIRFTISPEKVHIFDSETKKCLSN
ncbi:MAG: ABC transporter ATP-binding protein [Candidatus Zixiibacteriota bacterium]